MPCAVIIFFQMYSGWIFIIKNGAKRSVMIRHAPSCRHTFAKLVCCGDTRHPISTLKMFAACKQKRIVAIDHAGMYDIGPGAVLHYYLPSLSQAVKTYKVRMGCTRFFFFMFLFRGRWRICIDNATQRMVC